MSENTNAALSVATRDHMFTSVTISAGASTTELAQRARLIDETYKKIMKRDVHYGVIPGTSGKPSLLKAGAEKLLSLFNLGAVEPVIKETLLPEGHREYRIEINIKHYPTDMLVGCGMGLCSTMESKYRYRNVADYEVTDEVIPRDAKERKAEYRKKGYGMKKHEGEWVWVKYGDSERSENPDIADQYNTVLKMAVKRALVAGTLVVTGASDIFTQDVEDFATMGIADVKEDEEPKGVTTSTVIKKKAIVTEGIEVWDVSVIDVNEHKTEGGKVYYTVHFDKDRSAGTVDKDMAMRAAEIEGELKVEVRPGRTPKSWVLLKLLIPEAVEAA